jgi:hypothetical protein
VAVVVVVWRSLLVADVSPVVAEDRGRAGLDVWTLPTDENT